MGRPRKSAKMDSADIVGVFGGSGTGKSYCMGKLTEKDRRLIIWDVMDEYDDRTVIIKAWPALIKAVKAKEYRISFRPSFEDLAGDFSRFCRLVYAVGRVRVVVEELNQVTQPSYAPPAWRNLCSRGRHRGVMIAGASQRPASVDKDFIGNMTECFAGRLPYRNDWKSLEPLLGKDAHKLATLKKPGQLHWKA